MKFFAGLKPFPYKFDDPAEAKPLVSLVLGGLAEQAAEEPAERARNSPQALKRDTCSRI
jgi:hypothetical protein